MFYVFVVLAITGLIWLAVSNHALRVQWKQDQDVIAVQRDIIEQQRERNRTQQRKLTAIWKLFSDKDSLGV